MAAIITDRLKRQFINHLYNDVLDSSNNYYVGIGRSEPWDSSDAAPTPIKSQRDERNARLGMQAVKTAETVSFVVPRHNWSSGTIYSAFDDAYAAYPTNPYYVLTDENSVYMCIQPGRNAAGSSVTSTVKPTGTNSRPISTADGYVWKYLYTIGALDGTKFTSANFIPVTKVNDSAGTPGLSALQVNQRLVQEAATKGEIISIQLTNAGSGYTGTPTIQITGDNSGKQAAATATVSNGIVTKIEMNDSGAGSKTGHAFGSGYTRADVAINGGGGTGATARAVFGPDSGVGADPREDLRSFSLMFNSRIAGDENDILKVGNDFRQTLLLKNVEADSAGGDGPLYVADVGNTLNYLKLSTVSTPFTVDRTILGASSSAKGLVDFVDSSRIYYHQSEVTGFGVFQEGEVLTEQNGNGDGIVENAAADSDTFAYRFPDVNPFSGELLYIDNRSPIERSNDQTEDIKVVIQL